MLKTFSITDIGRKRKVNQDYIYTSEKPVGNLPNVFIVADGMGGHNAGDYASKVTVETMLAEMENSFEKNPTLIFRKAIEEANDVIRKRASEDEKLEGMGTTVVVASCMGRFLQVANVGDSRLYVVGSKIRQITRDHSYVEEMVRAVLFIAIDFQESIVSMRFLENGIRYLQDDFEQLSPKLTTASVMEVLIDGVRKRL